MGDTPSENFAVFFSFTCLGGMGGLRSPPRLQEWGVRVGLLLLYYSTYYRTTTIVGTGFFFRTHSELRHII